ncbi:MAG: DUF3619 family protein, partial [Betaproteobacteria bacterium]
MNEDEVARRIVARLDRNLTDLPHPTVQKLQRARMAALATYRPAGGSLGGQARQGRAFGWDRGLTARLVLPTAIVVASLTGLIYWQMSSQHDEELDTGLLAGELPLHAYTDPGFETWLKHS